MTEKNNEENADQSPDMAAGPADEPRREPDHDAAPDREADHDTPADEPQRESDLDAAPDRDAPADEALPPDDDPERAGDDDDYADDADDDDAEEESNRRPRLAMLLVGVLVAALFGVGAGLLATRLIGPPSPDQVVARVGDVEITRLDFVRNYQPGDDPQMVMDQLIDVELVIQEARNAGVEVDATRVETQIEQIKEQHGGDEEAYMAFLNSAGVDSEEDLRDLLERQQLIEAMILEHTRLEQVRSRHILLSAEDPEDTEEIEALESEAEALLEEIESGGDFAELAAENSDDPGSAEQGGNLGWVPRGVFVEPFEEAIFSMEPGEVRLVQSDFGWHIIEVLEGPEMRAAENQQLLQSPAGQQAFETTFIPWVDGLRSEQSDQIAVLVEPAELVPTPVAPVAPVDPADG